MIYYINIIKNNFLFIFEKETIFFAINNKNTEMAKVESNHTQPCHSNGKHSA